MHVFVLLRFLFLCFLVRYFNQVRQRQNVLSMSESNEGDAGIILLVLAPYLSLKQQSGTRLPILVSAKR